MPGASPGMTMGSLASVSLQRLDLDDRGTWQRGLSQAGLTALDTRSSRSKPQNFFSAANSAKVSWDFLRISVAPGWPQISRLRVCNVTSVSCRPDRTITGIFSVAAVVRNLVSKY